MHAIIYAVQEPDITGLIRNWQQGDASSKDELFEHLYKKLRAIAAGLLRSEQNAHSVSPTSLVHEGYMRIANWDGANLQDRQHFLALFSRVARRLIIDHAKKKKAAVHGGGLQQVEFEESMIRTDREADTILEIDRALQRLEKHSPRLCQVVEFMYFAGFTEEETASALAVSSKTVQRDWNKARMRLFGDLHGTA
jgi:RNA polymerase sigma factor (TIGR02999 family)